MAKKAKSAKKSVCKTPGAVKENTLVSFLLDTTGSMLNIKPATISGFNEYLASLKNQKKPLAFTLTQFNSNGTKIPYQSVPVKEVAPLTDETYCPDAGTPLYDAIGQTVRSIDEQNKKHSHVLFIILTDGLENASREFTKDGIATLIKEKEKQGWTFVYLGADQQSWDVGMGLGLARVNVANFNKKDSDKVFKTLGKASARYISEPHIYASCCFAGLKNDNTDDLL
jgi:hypothetical protein